MNTIDPNNTQPDDELDRLLDAELAKYASVNPRPGLDRRILANLRSPAPTAHTWWHWGLAAAVAAILVVLALNVRSSRLHPAVANHTDHPMSDRPMPDQPQKNPSPPDPAPEVQQASGGDSGVVRRPTPRPVLTVHALRHEAGVPKNPKLDQFPSPQPLTAEEIALVRYVKDFPKDAQLIAAAQREFALKAEKEMNDASPETQPSSSIQQDSIQQER